MPKCASTSIQSHFAKNYAAYARKGLLYPKAGRETQGYRSHRPLHDAALKDIPGLLDLIEAEARRRACHTVLLSSEELANSRFDRKVAGALIRNLQDKFGPGNLQVLFLIRDHVSFAQSAFSQFIANGMFRVNEKSFFAREPLSISGYADAFLKKNGFEFFSYSDFARRFLALSEGSAFEVMSIDPAAGDRTGIIERVCRMAGVPSLRTEAVRNSRLSEYELFALLHARRVYGFSKVGERQRLLLRGLPDRPRFRSPIFRIDSGLATRIAEAAERDRDFFQERFSVPIATDIQKRVEAGGPHEGPRVPDERLAAYIDAILSPQDMSGLRAALIAKRIFS